MVTTVTELSESVDSVVAAMWLVLAQLDVLRNWREFD